MKYEIQYIKNDRKYNFTISFKNESHRNKKLLQYKEGSLSFKMRRL